MANIRVPVVPFDKDGITHNVIDLELSYDKRATGPVLRLQAADTTQGTFRTAPFGSLRETMTWDAGWRTNNAKKMAQAREAVEKDIKNRSGRAWEAVKDFVKKHGMVIHSQTVELVTA
jgi:hypothetical protein